MREVVATEKAPAAVGPYSQAIKTNGFVYTAGQIPLDPATGQTVEGDIQAQTLRALQNLQAVLEAAGTGLEQVVKTTVFLQSMDDFGAMNEIYSRFFDQAPPARSAVEIARLPLGVHMEIEAVALAGD